MNIWYLISVISMQEWVVNKVDHYQLIEIVKKLEWYYTKRKTQSRLIEKNLHSSIIFWWLNVGGRACVWHHQLVNCVFFSSSCWSRNCDNWNWMFAYSIKSTVSLFSLLRLSLGSPLFLRSSEQHSPRWPRLRVSCRIYWHLNWSARCLRFIKDSLTRLCLIALWELMQATQWISSCSDIGAEKLLHAKHNFSEIFMRPRVLNERKKRGGTQMTRASYKF